MVNKFITFTTIKNNGRYKNYSNICFFISISDILQNYNISLSPRSLVKLSKFKGHNGEFFDTDRIQCQRLPAIKFPSHPDQ